MTKFIPFTLNQVENKIKVSKSRSTNRPEREPEILVPKEPDRIYIRKNKKNFNPIPYAYCFDWGYFGELKKLVFKK